MDETTPEFPRVRISKTAVATGYRYIHGRPHGMRWTPLWEVTVTFDTEERAQEFMRSLDLPEE